MNLGDTIQSIAHGLLGLPWPSPPYQPLLSPTSILNFSCFLEISRSLTTLIPPSHSLLPLPALLLFALCKQVNMDLAPFALSPLRHHTAHFGPLFEPLAVLRAETWRQPNTRQSVQPLSWARDGNFNPAALLNFLLLGPYLGLSISAQGDPLNSFLEEHGPPSPVKQ